jgi:hypothetical protein
MQGSRIKHAFMEGYFMGVKEGQEWGADDEEAYKAFKATLFFVEYTQEELVKMNRIQLIGIINRLQFALKG